MRGKLSCLICHADSGSHLICVGGACSVSFMRMMNARLDLSYQGSATMRALFKAWIDCGPAGLMATLGTADPDLINWVDEAWRQFIHQAGDKKSAINIIQSDQ